MKEEYKKQLGNKVILITGGTGSFGHSVMTELIKYKVKRVVIFSRDEKKQFDMRNYYNNPILRFIIGDVRDRQSVKDVIRGQKPDYIFHAAALKQVPTGEFFPLEIVKTNIMGASNVIEEATAAGVKRVVILSTDKAVYPINAMGMSKALMEKTMIASSRGFAEFAEGHNTVLCGVRYGNVLYSRGSVVPYFVNQIMQHKEMTVTNKYMTRFLLPLSDAVDLVLFSLTNGKAGDMYVRKSPACTIEVMAKALKKIFNYDKDYIEVGIRAGEKMHEVLVSREEMLRSENLKDYYRIPRESQGLDYSQYFFKGKSTEVLPESYTSENTTRLNISETADLLLKLPEIQGALKEYKKIFK